MIGGDTYMQDWLVVNWSLGNKFQWKLNHDTMILMQEMQKKMNLKMLSAKWWVASMF